MLLLFEQISFTNWSSLGLTVGMALVSVTSVIITTRSAVQSLKEQSLIIIDALKEQLKSLNGSVDKLGDTVQNLTVSVALRDERLINIDRRLNTAEEELKTVRGNFHHLRNWLTTFATEMGKTIHIPRDEFRKDGDS